MSIAIKIVGGVTQRFNDGDSVQVDSLERLSSSGNITIGSGLGVGEKISLASATSNGMEVLSDIISAGGIRLAEISKPTAATDTGWLYTKSISGNSELFYEDEGGTEVQITNAGAVKTEGLFGAGYSSAESLGSSNTTSDTYQDKISETTAALPAGTYLFMWHCQVETTLDAGSAGAALYRLYNSTDAAEVGPDWPVNTWDSGGAASRGPQYIGGSAEIVFAGVAKTLKIQYKSVVSGDTAYIQGARIQYWRVK